MLIRSVHILDTKNVTNLLASKFIARTDAKAVQNADGVWHLHTVDGKRESARLGWDRQSLVDHVEGTRTYGHYLLNQQDQCKLFAFDIDLAKSGMLPTVDGLREDVTEKQFLESFEVVSDLRAAWLNRAHPARSFMKLQFKEMAHMLLKTIWEELELPCAAAYSGAKGVHVYAFTGLIPASEAVEGARIVLDSLNCFTPLRGVNFFRHENTDRAEGYPNLTIEVFPKQGSLDGKDLGNLMRLPLGRNRKAPADEPAFFIDMTAPIGSLQPGEAENILNMPNPWIEF